MINTRKTDEGMDKTKSGSSKVFIFLARNADESEVFRKVDGRHTHNIGHLEVHLFSNVWGKGVVHP